MTNETIYSGHDNVVIRYLRDGREPVDLSSVIKMELRDAGCAVYLDSATSPGAFDWSGGGGKLVLKLGQEPVLPGTYIFYLIVYDPSNPDGVVWDKIKIKFIALCEI